MRNFFPIIIYLLLYTNVSAQQSQRILVINTFDAQSIHARKNKKELFGMLADSLEKMICNELSFQYNKETISLPLLTQEMINRDSSIFLLMDSLNISTAIVIKKLDAYFEQKDVVVNVVSNTKKRTAYYDICSNVQYVEYKKNKIPKETSTICCEHFTERDVISGFFAVGPDIVGKSKAAFKIIGKNGTRYLQESFEF